MPKLSETRVPSYRLHRQSGQGIVTLNGRDYLLGPHGTPESKAKYRTMIAQWEARGRRAAYANTTGVTVSRLIAEFWAHAKTYHRTRDGRLSPEAGHFRRVLIRVRRLFGDTPAAEFDPVKLKTVRAAVIKPVVKDGVVVRQGWARKYANTQMRRVVRVFKWGAEERLVPGSVCVDIGMVAPLRKGKTDAREKPKVRAVPVEWIEQTLRHVSRQVRAIAMLQLHSGCRPGEAVIMRGCDVDTTQKKWVYAPHYHKLEWQDLKREISLGPRSRAIVREFWKTDLQAYLFSPTDAEAERRAAMGKARKTPLSCGNRAGTNVVRRPERKPKDRYTVESYRRAIERACDAAFPLPPELARIRVKGKKGTRAETTAEWKTRLGPERWAEARRWVKEHRWCPLQVRHTAAKHLRRLYGIDAAQSVLGHQLGSMITEVYAEIDAEKVARIVEEVG